MYANAKIPAHQTSGTIRKMVDGNVGNKSTKFVFTINLSNSERSVDGFYDAEGAVEGTITINNGYASFTLSSGDYVTIKRLPKGTVVKITELGAEDYITVNDSGNSSADGKTAEFTLYENKDVTFTNTRNGILPTGVNANFKIAVIAGILCLLGIFILIVKRQI